MKANELRIGNYVTCLGEDREVIGITKHNGTNETARHYVQFKGMFPLMLVHIKPIPLTEEWLLKFGFVLDTDSHQIVFMNKTLSLYKQDGIYWCDILWDSLEIKHVHQLQNLYFALTGNELLFVNSKV